MRVGLMFATAFYMLGVGQHLAGLHPSIPVVALLESEPTESQSMKS